MQHHELLNINALIPNDEMQALLQGMQHTCNSTTHLCRLFCTSGAGMVKVMLWADLASLAGAWRALRADAHMTPPGSSHTSMVTGTSMVMAELVRQAESACAESGHVLAATWNLHLGLADAMTGAQMQPNS